MPTASSPLEGHWWITTVSDMIDHVVVARSDQRQVLRTGENS
jgi:hypothetical protein